MTRGDPYLKEKEEINLGNKRMNVLSLICQSHHNEGSEVLYPAARKVHSAMPKNP